MKVVIIGTRGFPNVQGGVEKHCENLAVHLVRLGCEVEVFTRRPYVDENIKEFEGVRLIALPTIKHKSLEAFLHTLLGVLVAVSHRPNILHIQAIGPALFVPLARLFGMKVVLTSHGSNYEHLKWGKFARLVLRLGEFLGVTFAHRIIAISEPIAEHIKKKYGKNARCILNGATRSRFVETERTLAKLELEKRKYILSVGRIVPEKGFCDLIDAFHKLQSESDRCDIKSWKLVIVGRADHEDTYSSKLRGKATASPNIILTGFLSGQPLQEIYSHAGLFVVPSYYEGLSLVLLEAMCYGISCIVSDIPANREVGISENRFFKAGDIDQLAEKIHQFMARQLSEEERDGQIRAITTKYSWERMAEQTLEVYSELQGNEG